MGCPEGYITAIVETLALLLVNSIVKGMGKKENVACRTWQEFEPCEVEER